MKIHSQDIHKDGTIDVKLCMCKGPSHCKPQDRPTKLFKSLATLKKWANAFKIRLIT